MINPAFSLWAVILMCMVGAVSVSSASEPPCDELVFEADEPIIVYRKVYVNESLPELGARLHDQIDYELWLQRLRLEIELTVATIAAQRERVRVYDRHFSRSSALFITRQNAQLDLLQSQQRLQLLRQEQLLALRHRNSLVDFRGRLIDSGKVRLNLTE